MESAAHWGVTPFATVIAERQASRDRLSALVAGAGGEVAASIDFTGARQRLADRRPTGLILLEINADEELEALPLLDAAVRETASEGQPLILSGASATTDWLAPAGLAPHVIWLSDAGPADEATAVALAMGDAAPALADVSTELDPVRLRRLADEVSRIARTLANISSAPAGSYVADAPVSFRSELEDLDDLAMPSADEIRTILRLRRLRDRFFDAALFADPAWDMLLDLLAARLERAQVAVSSLCIAAAVPPTTALRWIKTMTDHGLFERCADPEDGRRIFIQLADHAAHGLARYFAAAKRIGGTQPIPI